MKRKEATKAVMKNFKYFGSDIIKAVNSELLKLEQFKSVTIYEINVMINPKKTLQHDIMKFNEYKKYESYNDYDSLSRKDFVGWFQYHKARAAYTNYARTKYCMGCQCGWEIYLFIDRLACISAKNVNSNYGKNGEENRKYFDAYFDMFVYELLIATIHELIHIDRIMNILTQEEVQSLPSGRETDNSFRNENEEYIAETESVHIANTIIDELLKTIKSNTGNTNVRGE